ncbi:hypothetical protein GUQ72_000733 [Salmonella enterica subsp. enterica]|nr:hypothetical protein [Salmonella enterica subsp. enterica serovar Tudu]
MANIKHSQEVVSRCREMRLAGDRVQHISSVTGVPVSTIYQIISGDVRDGAGRYQSWTSERIEFVRQCAGKLPAYEIAKQVGRSINAVYLLASREGFSLLGDIDPHDEWLCCELYKEGLTMKLIAKKLELTPYQVSKIIKSRGLR